MMKNVYLIYHDNKIICNGFAGEADLDEHSMFRLERQNDVRIVNKEEPLEDNNLYNFALDIVDNVLVLSILKGEVVLTDVYDIIWTPIYTAKFTPNSHVIEENGEEDIEFWIDMLKNNFYYDNFTNHDVYMGDDYNEDIRKLFPSICHFGNIADFIKSYTTSGIYVNEVDGNIFKNIVKQKADVNIGKKYSRSFVSYCQMRQMEIGDEVFFEVLLTTGHCVDGTIRVINKGYAYITKNNIYNISITSLHTLLNTDIIYGMFKYDKFVKKYPELMFEEYIKSGGKYYIPFLLSSVHNRPLELMGKAGLGSLSNYLEDYRNVNLDGKNLKEIFGLPVKALKALNTDDICSYIKEKIETSNRYTKEVKTYNFKTLQQLYELQPAIFSEKLNRSVFKFLDRVSEFSITLRDVVFNKKEIIKYVRYASKLRDDEMVILYVDYLAACYRCNLFPYGKFPEALKLAHDVMMNYEAEKREANKVHNFSKVVNSIAYQELLYEKGDYVILAPRNPDDLVQESYQMSNCVRGYVDSVANGRTFILFLRNKGSKSKSFVTIEVSSMYNLVQAKGKANSVVTKDVAKWIREWCEIKGISHLYNRDLERAEGKA